MNILFVCHGNICRSPMAEFIMKDIVKKNNLNINVSSCATSTEEIGNDIYYLAKKELDKHNIIYSKRRARRLTIDDYYNNDLIFYFDYNNKRNIEKIIKEDPDNKMKMLLENEIEDPWYTGNFEKVYDEILTGCNNVINKIINMI